MTNELVPLLEMVVAIDDDGKAERRRKRDEIFARVDAVRAGLPVPVASAPTQIAKTVSDAFAAGIDKLAGYMSKGGEVTAEAQIITVGSDGSETKAQVKLRAISHGRH